MLTKPFKRKNINSASFATLRRFPKIKDEDINHYGGDYIFVNLSTSSKNCCTCFCIIYRLYMDYTPLLFDYTYWWIGV